DFYEFFGDAARLVERELDLKVSEKSSHGSSYAMAGVPVDDLTPYLKQLVERGYRVAVADQRGDDTTREITRVVTPGTLLETEDVEARYLAAVVRADEGVGVAFADVTTGRFHAATVGDVEDALAECYRFDPVEVLPGPHLRNDDEFLAEAREATDATVTPAEANAFAPGAARHAVRERFGDGVIEGLDLAEPTVRAAGAALAYVADTGAGVLESMTRLQPYGAEDGVRLDATTQRTLELTEPMSEGGQSLLDTIDHTVTSAGSRLLRSWLTRPRRDTEVLARRSACVEAFAEAALAREAVRETLSEAADLERAASRAVHGSADPRDLRRVCETLGVLDDLRERVEGDRRLADSPLSGVLERVDAEAVAELRETLDAALAEDPPGTVTEGGVFRRGFDPELDEVIADHEEALAWMDGLADREKRETGITHLQVDRNRTDGYYIQVGKSEADEIPESYEEIKTLKNSKRYTTAELRERERELLRLEERREEFERDLFEELRGEVADRADLLQTAGRALAEVDVLGALATHAVENDWTRPELRGADDDPGGERSTGDTTGIDIQAGRHPVVEQTTEFVPNDARLDADRRFLIVTGPNMSGKSTYMRQVALIVLLAQVGSFVPADRARIEPVDAIFTRVGALDELAEGRSTFMVEMGELSNILHAATEDSLVILDEVGRGTATYDGISIAWAATEYLHNEVRAKTLFATHYHELTALADHLPRVENVHVAVAGEPRSPAASETESRAAEERGEDVTFLRTVREGPTDRSYGIHVADLAGVPEPVVGRSREVLERLREEKAIEARGGSGGGTQQVVFDVGSGEMRTADDGQPGSTDPAADAGTTASSGENGSTLDPAEREILEELRDVDPAEVTPADLLARIEHWQDELSEQ
ncbi:MAG: DNA mismatch repair protein MutS, partial [Halobacteriales archaeon]